MPALNVVNSQIEETLRSSLVEGRRQETLADLLISQSRAVLLKKIEFVDASNQTCEHHHKVKSKYVLTKMTEQLEKKKPVVVLNGEHKKSLDGVGLPEPKVVLYDGNKLSPHWRGNLPRMGTGLNNLGNTCFCNATLQCLTFTPALYYYLMSREHSKQCCQQGFCMLCIMEDHIRNASSKIGMGYSPWSVVRNFKCISKHFTLGRQEDAHEFLRYVIDNMAKALLLGKPKLDAFSKTTTAVHQIFGGFLRSQVRCKNCDYKSNTYDPFLDIALDIKEANNIQRALEHFTKGESLFGENAYSCDKCKRKVGAVKRFSLHKIPNVMTLQLKRFDAVRLNKINRDVHFPESLNIRPFMSCRQGDPVLYQLYGVLVHQGFSTNSGHYFSFVKSPSGQWLKMDDSRVHKVGLELVLRQTAYILFYNKTDAGMKKNIQHNSIAGVQQKPNILQARHVNGPMGNPVNELGTPVVRKTSPSATITRPGQQQPQPSLLIRNQSQGPSLQKTAQTPNYSKIASLAGRDKISFGIKSRTEINQGKEASNQSNTSASGDKLVIKIKDGKVVSNTASPPPKSKVPLTNPTPTIGALMGDGIKRKLVPYGQDGSSDSDNSSDNNIFDNINRLKVKNGSGDCGRVNDGKTNGAEGNSSSGNQFNIGINKINNHATGFNNKVNFSNGENNKQHVNNTNKVHISPKSKESLTGNSGKNNSQGFVPIMDEKLKATTEVPGAYAPLDRKRDATTGNGFRSPVNKVQHENNVNGDKGQLLIKLASPETVKVNSTTKWTVFDNGQESPSLASSSSSSVNSTSDWKVDGLENNKNGQAQKVNGWSVTESPSHKANAERKGMNTATATVGSKVAGNTNEEGLVINGWTVHVVNDEDDDNNESKLDQKAGSFVEKQQMHGSKGHQNGVFNNSHSNRPSPKLTPTGPKIFQQSNSSGGVSHQHPSVPAHNANNNKDSASRKENQQQAEKSCIANSSGGLESSPSPRKQLFAKSNDAVRDDDKNETQAKVESSSENSFHSSDTQPLLENQTDTSLHKKHKKKKKKHKHNEEMVNEYNCESSGEKSKKKKKKKKRKYNSDEEDNDQCPLLSEPSSAKKMNTMDNGTAPNGSAPPHGEYEWVERTKESIEQETQHRQNENGVPNNKTRAAPVVQKWDRSFNKKFTQNGEQSHDRGSTNGYQHNNGEKLQAAWDGSRNNHSGDVLAELHKDSLRGYGSSVSGWDGNKSSIDQEAIRDFRKDKKRGWEDDYEDELNTGKVKKVKKNIPEERFGGPNYFQQNQSYQNMQHNNKHQHRNLFEDVTSPPTYNNYNSHERAFTKPHQYSNHHQPNNYNSNQRGRGYHNNNKFGNGQPYPNKFNSYNNRNSDDHYRGNNRGGFRGGRGGSYHGNQHFKNQHRDR